MAGYVNMNPMTAFNGKTSFGGDYATEAEDIERSKKMAEMLQQQAMHDDLKGGMVGRVYVPSSMTQGLAKMLQAYAAKSSMDEASQRKADLSQRMGQDFSTTMGDALKLQQGTPAQNQTLLPGLQGPEPENFTPAIPADPKAAMARMAQSQHPVIQQMVQQQMLKQMTPEVSKFGNTPHYDQNGRAYVLDDHGNAKFLGDIKQRDELVADNLGGTTQLRTKYSPTPVTTVPHAANPFSDLVVKDPVTGEVVQNTPLVAAKKAIQKEGASKNVVNVAAPENEYNKDVGKALAKSSTDAVEVAKAAPEVINNARSILKALDSGAITGTGASLRQSVQKAMETAGVVGKGKAASTEELMAGLGKLTLSGIKTSGLGGGNGFTDKDREFLNSAISGQIESTPANLRRVAMLSERVARANHAKGKKILDRWQQDPALKAVAQDTQLDDIGGGDIHSQAEAILNGGK